MQCKSCSGQAIIVNVMIPALPSLQIPAPVALSAMAIDVFRAFFSLYGLSLNQDLIRRAAFTASDPSGFTIGYIVQSYVLTSIIIKCVAHRFSCTLHWWQINGRVLKRDVLPRLLSAAMRRLCEQVNADRFEKRSSRLIMMVMVQEQDNSLAGNSLMHDRLHV